jgi:hypothetical protein
MVNVGLVCGMWGRGIEEGGRDSLKTFGDGEDLLKSVEERNGKVCTLCDFNGKWLKD